jgi:hypothetical protein
MDNRRTEVRFQEWVQSFLLYLVKPGSGAHTTSYLWHLPGIKQPERDPNRSSKYSGRSYERLELDLQKEAKASNVLRVNPLPHVY